MEKINDTQKTKMLFAVILCLLILNFFQTCSTKNKVSEESRIMRSQMDSLTQDMKELRIDYYKANVDYLTELQKITYSISLKNKEEIIDQQTKKIKELNARINQYKKK